MNYSSVCSAVAMAFTCALSATIASGAVATGTVRDYADGTGIAGVAVSGTDASGKALAQQPPTDANGSYRIPGLPAGSTRLAFARLDYLQNPKTITVDLGGAQKPIPDVELFQKNPANRAVYSAAVATEMTRRSAQTQDPEAAYKREWQRVATAGLPLSLQVAIAQSAMEKTPEAASKLPRLKLYASTNIKDAQNIEDQLRQYVSHSDKAPPRLQELTAHVNEQVVFDAAALAIFDPSVERNRDQIIKELAAVWSIPQDKIATFNMDKKNDPRL